MGKQLETSFLCPVLNWAGGVEYRNDEEDPGLNQEGLCVGTVMLVPVPAQVQYTPQTLLSISLQNFSHTTPHMPQSCHLLIP